MYAAAPGAVARDGDRPVFVDELLKAIRAPGKIEEAFNRTMVGVSRATQGEQIPWFSSSLVEDFSFATAGRATPDPAPTPAGKNLPAPRPDPDAAVQLAYQSAESAGTKKAWEDFVQKNPSGRYAELARQKLAALALASNPATPVDDPAIKELDKKIALNRDDAAAYYKRGQLYAQHGDFSRAVTDFDEVIRLNPKDVEGLNNRCWARAMLGELQPALKDCDAALELRPRYLDALDSRGLVNLKLGQPKNAIADYDAALRINPKHPSALYGRGIAKMRTGNTAGGDGDVAAAKLIQPDIADEFASYGIP
jgi:tetratricopeptide (TPR) repeat protein